jgi:hypothetical protein
MRRRIPRTQQDPGAKQFDEDVAAALADKRKKKRKPPTNPTPPIPPPRTKSITPTDDPLAELEQ